MTLGCQTSWLLLDCCVDDLPEEQEETVVTNMKAPAPVVSMFFCTLESAFHVQNLNSFLNTRKKGLVCFVRRAVLSKDIN